MIDKNFHYIVRGVIRDGDYFLLCKQRNGDYRFLLGGHIDSGEGAKVALAREIKEEIGANVHIKMTLTAPGCGMGPMIAEDAKNKVLSIPGVKDVNVELVWEPQWNKDMMTEEAKLQLGML